MRILAFSDWRVQPLDMMMTVVEAHKPDAILYAGDDIDRFVTLNRSLLFKTSNSLLELSYPNIEPIFSEDSKHLSPHLKKMLKGVSLPNNNILQRLELPFYYVNGNDDFLLFVNNTYYTRIHSGRFFVDGGHYKIAEDKKGEINAREINPFFSSLLYEGGPDEEYYVSDPSVLDSGIYAPINPSFGQFTIGKERGKTAVTGYGVQCEFGLQSKIKNKPSRHADIFLSHLPPLGVLDLSVRFGIDHIGSKELLNAIKKYQPRLVICGHSHIWGGFSRKIGDTVIINVSSQDRDPSYGNYALINTEDWSVELKTVEKKTIRNIRGMNTVRSKVKRKMRESTVSKHKETSNALNEIIKRLNPWRLKASKNFSETLEKIDSLGVDTTTLKERIESINWDTPRIKRRISFNPERHSFVDVETGLAQGLEPGKLWLVGLWHAGEVKQFVIPDHKRALLKYLRENRITSLVSWTRYDSKALRPLLEKAGIEISFIDACQRASNCCAWYTYRLHELYNALFGDTLSDDLIPGHIAGLYADHLIISNKRCPHCPPKKEMEEQIKKRNWVDILQMIEICKKLWNV